MFIKTISKVIHLTDKIEHLYLPSMSNKITKLIISFIISLIYVYVILWINYCNDLF
jgi:hypothetical protein